MIFLEFISLFVLKDSVTFLSNFTTCSSSSPDVPEYLITLFGVSWIADTSNALHETEQEKKENEKILKQNQTLEEFFFNILNFLNGDMWTSL